MVRENFAYRLSGVKKIRQKSGVVFELRVPALTVERGRFVAVVGPSGCGKSTLLDMLGLISRPSEHEEFFLRSEGSGEGEVIDVGSISSGSLAAIRMSCIGYVLQTGGLLPFLSVRDNIMLPCRFNGRGDGEARMNRLSRLFGIHDQLNKKPKYLSGGQRQRVAITRALVHQPPIVLADEPTAAVDKLTAMSIMGKFKQFTEEMGVTLVLVTHDRALASEAAEKMFSFEIEQTDKSRTRSTLVEWSNA